VLRFGDRRYRVRGLAKNTSFDSLRVNVLVSREELPDKFFVDTLDLYSARQRTTFEKQAATDIGLKEEVLHRELGQLLRALEQLQEEQIRRALEPKEKPASMNEAEQSTAMQLLRDPNLVQRILADFAACGMVGEETNKLMGYLAAVSRKLEQPLAIVVQSSSAAGNMYSYVRNNPITRIDPTGRCGEDASFIGPRIPCAAQSEAKPKPQRNNSPAQGQEPGTQEIPDGKGGKTVRTYGPDGRAVIDWIMATVTTAPQIRMCTTGTGIRKSPVSRVARRIQGRFQIRQSRRWISSGQICRRLSVRLF
jgi:hypothetical protein